MSWEVAAASEITVWSKSSCIDSQCVGRVVVESIWVSWGMLEVSMDSRSCSIVGGVNSYTWDYEKC